MGDLKLQFITNDEGYKIGVFLSIEQYNQLVKQLEELEDIKAFDKYKTQKQEFLPFDQATKEIEDQRSLIS